MKSRADLEGLPQELKDLIVDHISHISDESERTQTLCATALVSRQFRYWAHKRLFATVILRGKQGKPASAMIRRLCQLRDIIEADPHSDITGIASHIRSFTLSLGGHRSCVLPPLEDNSLPVILQKIHRTGSRPRSLSIILFMPGDNDQLDWMSLRPDFRSALVDVSRSPLLSTFRLRGFRNLPQDILAGSSIDNIKFNNISIKDYSRDECSSLPPPVIPQFMWKEYFVSPPSQETDFVATTPAFVLPDHTLLAFTQKSTQSIPSPSSGSDLSDGQSYPDSVLLETIETDHTFPLFHVLDLTSARSHPAEYLFRRLKSLTMNIRDAEGLKKTAEMFNSAPSVEKLEIKLNCTSISPDALSFQPLCNLRHLRLIHRLPTPGFNTLSPVRPHPTVQDMLNLLSSAELPKTLRRISITLSLKPPYRFYFPATLGTNSEQGDVGAAINSNVAHEQGNIGPFINDRPNIASESSNPGRPPTILLIKRLFALCSDVLKPLDELLGYPSSSSSSSPSASQTYDRFGEVSYYTIRLEVDLYMVPKEFTKQREKEFAEEAGEYVKSEFFPKLNERFDKVDDMTLERRSGGFGVVVTPRFRSSP